MQERRADDLAREKELVRREKARVLNELLQSQLKKQQEETDYAQLMADLYEYEREEQEREKERLQKEKRYRPAALRAGSVVIFVFPYLNESTRSSQHIVQKQRREHAL